MKSMSMPALAWPELEERTASLARSHRGRHQNHELASYRRTKAVELRLAGHTFDQIAAEVGYTSRSTAYNVVTTALRAREEPTKRERLQEHVARLQELLDSLELEAAKGNIRAVLVSLKVLDFQARLLNLFPPPASDPKSRWDNCAGPATVVVRKDDCRHEGCLIHGTF